MLKKDIRKSILAQREQLPADTRASHSAAITERLLQLPDYRLADAVLGYMNFGAEFASELWVERGMNVFSTVPDKVEQLFSGSVEK